MSEKNEAELPKTMLILKSNASALGAAETFLRNRGWKIFSTMNLKEALVQIVKNRPSYVLISVDHPNKKVRALPKLLSQAFPVANIVFAENQNTASYKTLNESSAEYRVYPPVTGPAIERCVNKYLKDQQMRTTAETANNSFKSENSAAASEAIAIKGGGHGHISIKAESGGFGDEKASRLFSQFLNEENPSSLSSSGKSDNNLVFAQPLEEEESSSGPGFAPGDPGGEAAQGGSFPAYRPAEDEGARQQKEANGFGGTYVQKGAPGEMGGYIPPNEDLGGWGSARGESPDKSGTAHDGMGSREYRRSHSPPAWEPSPEKDEYLKGKGREESRTSSDVNETLIARGTQKSLEESVELRDGVVTTKLKETTSAACISVESSRFSGYLVTVMGHNKKIDAEFMAGVKQRLFKFLKDNGEDVSDSNTMDVKIREVDFEPWALEYADFLRKSVHQGNEVVMAFFPRRPLKALIEESHHDDMAKIQLNELQGDRQVEFDLYVYLPTNDKYVLYTPKGGVFYNKQMDRLKKQGITHMHVQKDAVQEVSKYKAQNYLNDMVEDYEQKMEGIAKPKVA